MSRTQSTKTKTVYGMFSALALAAAALLVMPAEAAPPGGGMMGQGMQGQGLAGCDMQGPGMHRMGMGGMGGMGMLGHGPMAGMGGPGMERMLAGVNATEEQRAQITKIMETARAEMAGQREAGQALRTQMMELFAQPTIDAAAVEALRKQMQAHREVGSQRMTQAMLQASSVLTPEQRKQVAEQMTQRRATMQQHRQYRQQAPRQGS